MKRLDSRQNEKTKIDGKIAEKRECPKTREQYATRALAGSAATKAGSGI